MKKLLLFLVLLTFSLTGVYSQQYKTMMDSGDYTVFEIQEAAELYFSTRSTGKGSGYKQYKRWEYNALHSMDEFGSLSTKELQLKEYFRNNKNQNRLVDSSNWEELGPTTWNSTSGWNPGVGRITSFAVDPDDQDHIIVGSPTGGVWRTVNGGATWTVLTDNFINLDVYSLSIHPVNKSTYYWGSTSGIIFVSYDSGANWAQLGNLVGSDVNKILIHPNTPNTMFCTIAGGGVFRSTNAGATWSSALTGESTGYDIEFKPGDTNTLYATGNRFYRSTNGGASFSEVSSPFTSGQTKMIGVSPDDATVVYVVEENNGIFGGFYKSTNSGSSFSELTHSANYFGYSDTGNDTSGQAPRDMDIVVSPVDVDEVHIAGIHTWRSLNGGVSFTLSSYWSEGGASSRNVGYCHADVDIMEFVGSNLYVGSDGGLYINDDSDGIINNSFYTDLTAGLGIRQFYKIGVSQTDPELIVGGSQDNGSSFYNTSGQWFDWLGADGMENFIDKNNSNIFYGTSQGGVLYKSTNGGSSYFGLTEPGSGNWVTPFEQDPITQNVIYVGYDRVYKSTNGGSSWNSISQDFGPNMDYLKIAPSNNLVMYGSVDGSLYKTTDGGATNWATLSGFSGSFINDIAIHPSDPNRVAIATNSSDKVYISEDGGATWTPKRLNLPNFSVYALVWEDVAENRLFVGMDYGIYHIEDSSAQWQLFANNLPNVRVYELEINTANGMLYAGTYGRGVFRSFLPCSASFNTALDTICESQGTQTGLFGGTPAGGTYSGTGVTDNGDGTFDFDPSVGGPGNTTVTYTVVDGCSGSVVDLDDTIIVTNSLPELVCQDVTIVLDGGGNAVINESDVIANLSPGGYVIDQTGVFAPIDMTGSTSVSLGDDDSASASLDFDFIFFQNTFTSINISSNGYLSFSGSGLTEFNNDVLPDPNDPQNVIAAAWDDLNPNDGGTIHYKISGNAPHRIFVVEYFNIPHYGSGGSTTITSQVHLYEGTGIIEIHSANISSDGGGLTQGIENGDGTIASTPTGRNEANWTATNDFVSFTPTAGDLPDNCGFSVSASFSQSVFTCQDIGDVVVTVTADDGNGGITTCDAIVTVQGTTSTYAAGSWDVAPNAGSKALFQDSYSTVDGDVTACSCEIEAGNTVTVTAGRYMEIEGNILVDGVLDIEHEGSVVQNDDAATTTNNGSIIVRKTTPSLTPQGFMIMGSPMTAETREGVYGSGRRVLHHITGNFVPNPLVEILSPGTSNWADDNGNNWGIHTGVVNGGEGYFVRPQPNQATGGSFNLDYTLGTLNNGIVNYNVLFNNNQNDSPNMMGNPYASAIDAEQFFDAPENAMINEVYFWNHITPPLSTYPGYQPNNFSMGDISRYVEGSGGVAAANGGGVPNQFIASGQGFGVKPLSAGTAVFNNGMRVTGPNDTYRNSENNRQRIWLDIKNNTYGLASNMLIAFMDNASDTYDEFDGIRIATPVSLYSVVDTNEELAIQGRSSFNEEQEVQIGFSTMVEEVQTYSISIREIEGDEISEATVYLHDKLLNTITNLSEENFVFTSNATHNTDRFVLLFQERILNTNDAALQSIRMLPNPTTGMLLVNSPTANVHQIEVIDLQGRIVSFKHYSNSNQYLVDLRSLESAMYFVKLYTSEGALIKRVIRK